MTVDFDELKAMVEGGMTIQSIAEEIGVTPSRVSQLLSAMGLSGSVTRKSSLSKLTPEEKQDAADRYVTGEPVAAIIMKYGLNYNSFYRLLNEMGVEMRDRGPASKEIRKMRVDLAMRLYQLGVTLAQIEIETGIRQPEIHREVHRRGMPLRRGSSGGGLGGGSGSALLTGDEEELLDLEDLTNVERDLLDMGQGDPETEHDRKRQSGGSGEERVDMEVLSGGVEALVDLYAEKKRHRGKR